MVGARSDGTVDALRLIADVGSHAKVVRVLAAPHFAIDSFVGKPSNREKILTEGLRVVHERGFAGASVRYHS
jgi:hypothetical protein